VICCAIHHIPQYSIKQESSEKPHRSIDAGVQDEATDTRLGAELLVLVPWRALPATKDTLGADIGR
jgi:hypothetical protein